MKRFRLHREKSLVAFQVQLPFLQGQILPSEASRRKAVAEFLQETFWREDLSSNNSSITEPQHQLCGLERK
jgi:hypothetical protein